MNEMKRMARRAVEAEAKVKELDAKLEEKERVYQNEMTSEVNELESTRRALEKERSLVITLCTSTRKSRAEIRAKIRNERGLGSGPGDDAEPLIEEMKSKIKELDKNCETQKIELNHLQTQLEDAKKHMNERISRHSNCDQEVSEENNEEKQKEVRNEMKDEEKREYEERIEHLTISLALHLGEVRLMHEIFGRLKTLSKKTSLAYGGVKASVPRKKARRELRKLHRQLLRIENLAKDDVEFELYQEDIDDYDKLANGVFEVARQDYDTVMAGLRENPHILCDDFDDDDGDDVMLPNLSLSLSVRDSHAVSSERISTKSSLPVLSDDEDDHTSEEEYQEEKIEERGRAVDKDWNAFRVSIESMVSDNVNESVKQYLNVFDMFSSEKAKLFCYIIVRKNTEGAFSLRLEIENSKSTTPRKDIVEILNAWIANPELNGNKDSMMSPWSGNSDDENSYENMFFSMSPSVSEILRPIHVAELCDVRFY